MTKMVEMTHISLAHYFEQNGDLCADPEMEIRLDHRHGVATPLTFNMSLPPIRQRVYSADGKRFSPGLLKELNSFLRLWTTNLRAQGHKVWAEREAA